MSRIGVHDRPVQLNLDKLWAHNTTFATRLVDTVTTPMLLKTVASGKLQPKQLITHHFALNKVMEAYDIFRKAMKERALKVILAND
jgi:alcohol dehydrogenase